jgi:hypothetical protein
MMLELIVWLESGREDRGGRLRGKGTTEAMMERVG